MTRAVSAGILALAGALTAGCTSTQEKSRGLADEGRGAFQERGLRIARANPSITVLDTAVVSDENGAAAVVVLRSRAKRDAARLPVAIDVQGDGGRSLFRNDAPGLEPSLTSVSALSSGGTVAWVNDQVVSPDRPRRVVARVGTPRGRVTAALPELRVRRLRLEDQGTTGLAARGLVENRSRIEQRELVLYGVARRGERIVAAGRAQVRRVKPGRRASFRMFFIGSPRGAEISVSVPPTRLR